MTPEPGPLFHRSNKECARVKQRNPRTVPPRARERLSRDEDPVVRLCLLRRLVPGCRCPQAGRPRAGRRSGAARHPAGLWRRAGRADGHHRRRGAGGGRRSDRHHPRPHPVGGDRAHRPDRTARGRQHAHPQADDGGKVRRLRRPAGRPRHARRGVRGADLEAVAPARQADHRRRRRWLLAPAAGVDRPHGGPGLRPHRPVAALQRRRPHRRRLRRAGVPRPTPPAPTSPAGCSYPRTSQPVDKFYAQLSRTARALRKSVPVLFLLQCPA